MSARYTAADYLAAFQMTMPRGAAWTRDPAAIQTKTLSGLATSMERLDGDANQLLIDAFPATAGALLPEWEASLGLPDASAGQAPSTGERRLAVVARLAGPFGPQVASYAALAMNFGFAATVETFAPFRADENTAEQPVGEDPWAFALAVTLQEAVVGLSTWAASFVASELQAMTPAHEVLLPFGATLPYAGSAGGGTLDFSDPDNSGLIGH